MTENRFAHRHGDARWLAAAQGWSVFARGAALFAVLLGMCGCIPYPIYKTLQPRASVTVSDPEGRPMSGATVTLISSAYPHRFEKFRVSVVTRDGLATFSSVKDLRVESLGLHGAELYFWNWCVHHEGFETIETAHRSSAGFDRSPEFVLQPGISTPCPPDPARTPHRR